MDKQHAFNKIKEISEAVNQGGSALENFINSTALSLDDDLNSAFPINETTKYIFDDVNKKLNINRRRLDIKNEIGSPSGPAGVPSATGIYLKIDEKSQEITNYIATVPAGAKSTIYQDQLNELKNQLQSLRQDLVNKQNEYKALEMFDRGGLYKGAIISRKSEIQEIKDAHNIFDLKKSIPVQVLPIGGAATPPSIDLDPIFDGTTDTKDYLFYDEKQKKRIRPGDPLIVTAITASGNQIQVTLKGVEIVPGSPAIGGRPAVPTKLSISNLEVEGDVSDSPLQIRDLYVRSIHQNSAGRSFYHDKKLGLTINNPIKNLDLTERHAKFAEVESNLTNTFIQARLRQEFENKFNKLQREAFEKALSTNPEFAKLNQAQKDRLYQRMQEVGTIATGAVNVKIGDNIPPATGALEYPISEISFSPSTHDYSTMPSAEDYAGFSLWLANQAPKDVLAKVDAYKEWLTNGLVASMGNGKTHYENFFADVLQKFTDDINVKTTLNQTLLEFINDTNTADHMAFDADLLANLTSPQKPDYLGFFQGQSQEFKTESITVGGKTFGYSGKLEIQNAQSMIVSLKMQDGQEQIHKSGTPVGLVRELLRSPDIEPPHLRFHAGLSIAKSIVKLARANGISLRSALTPEMLATLPISVRDTLTTPPAENPMVEIEERDGKIVAKVFNLNLTTRRKENEYKMFDEQDFVATQSVRDLRQGVESLLSLTGHVLNDTYTNYRQASRGGFLRRALLSKHRYGGLTNFWKTISFEGESITIGGKTVNLDCKNGLFTFTGSDLKKPISGRNLGNLLIKNPALRGIELKALHIANEKMIETYQDKLAKKDRLKNYGVIDELNHRVYILDKDGNLGYVDNISQDFVSRWRQYSSGHSYGRIKDGDMPTGFRVMKKGKTVVDKESYENFLRNESLVGPMVRAMSRTHRAVTTWAPWD